MRSVRPALVIVAIALIASGGASARQQEPAAPAGNDTRQPRFRSAANLVRVDTYVTANGEDVKDLTIDDAYVNRMLADIVGNDDLSRYIL